MQLIKKYWYVLAAIIIYMMMGKKKTTRRRRPMRPRMQMMVANRRMRGSRPNYGTSMRRRPARRMRRR